MFPIQRLFSLHIPFKISPTQHRHTTYSLRSPDITLQYSSGTWRPSSWEGVFMKFSLDSSALRSRCGPAPRCQSLVAISWGDHWSRIHGPRRRLWLAKTPWKCLKSVQIPRCAHCRSECLYLVSSSLLRSLICVLNILETFLDQV